MNHLGPPLPRFDDALEAELLRFEAAWQAGKPQELNTFRPEHSPADFLLELSLIDQERRFRAGLPCAIETYLIAFPELDSQAILHLASAEFTLRGQNGQEPSTTEYCQRFPYLIDSLLEALGPIASPLDANRSPSVALWKSPAASKSAVHEIAGAAEYRSGTPPK